jgi:hypothetical protein
MISWNSLGNLIVSFFLISGFQGLTDRFFVVPVNLSCNLDMILVTLLHISIMFKRDIDGVE